MIHALNAFKLMKTYRSTSQQLLITVYMKIILSREPFDEICIKEKM